MAKRWVQVRRGGMMKRVLVDESGAGKATSGSNVYDSLGNLLGDKDLITSKGVAHDVKHINGVPVDKLISPTGMVYSSAIDFSDFYLNATLDNVGDGATRYGMNYTLAGHNLMPARWAMFNTNGILVQSALTQGSQTITGGGSLFGGYSGLRYTQLSAYNGQHCLFNLRQSNEPIYNIPLDARIYIFSFYVGIVPTIDLTTMTIEFIGNSGTVWANPLIQHIAGTKRWYCVADLTATTDDQFQLRFLNAAAEATGNILDIQGLQLEVQNGANPKPSPWHMPSPILIDASDAIGGIMGSTPASVADFLFTCSTTTTTIVISWGAVTLRRADGTTTAISAASSGTISGLTAGTSYWYYIYWDEVLQAVKFVNGSGHGSAGVSFTAPSGTAASAQCNLGRVPLSNGGIKFTQPASGSGNGSGGGTGCLSAEDFLETDHGILRAGMLLDGHRVRLQNGWGAVSDVRETPQREFVEIITSDGQTLIRTPSHKVKVADAGDGHWMAIKDLKLNDILMTASGLTAVKRLESLELEGLKISFSVEGHEFAAVAGGVIEHNTNVKP